MILNAQPNIEVVGEAANGVDAVELAQRLRPDVCLLDIGMPKMDGIEATVKLAGPKVADPIPIVIITTFDRDEYVFGALKAGARCFLLKDADQDLLVQAVHAAATGDALVAPNITARLLQTFASIERPTSPTQPVDPLTEREEEVLAEVARGKTNAEIAEELFISNSTVKTHVARLMTKLQARKTGRDRHLGLRHRTRRLDNPCYSVRIRTTTRPNTNPPRHLRSRPVDAIATQDRSVLITSATGVVAVGPIEDLTIDAMESCA